MKKKKMSERPHFMPPPPKVTTRCDWCGKPPAKRDKGGRLQTLEYAVSSMGHTESARVCTSECGRAWKEWAKGRVAQLNRKFIDPGNMGNLTGYRKDAILRVGREVR